MSHEYELAFEGSPNVGYFSREVVDIVAREHDFAFQTATIVWNRIHQIAEGEIEDKKIYHDPRLGPCELGIIDPDNNSPYMSQVNGDALRHIIDDPENQFHKRHRIGIKAVELSRKIIERMETANPESGNRR